MSITNYQIGEQIHESDQSLVYKGILLPENLPIIVKILKENYPSISAFTHYKQEYEITRSLNTDLVIKAYQLQRHQNSLAIFLEDFGGKSLNFLILERQFTLKEFLTIAIEIAQSLAVIHNENIIHKDINPSNIVYNQKTGQLKIIDFGISTRLSEENQTTRNLNQLEGTLAYIAPEQTGRMNRGIDYRSDFYSLGVTLYELLTHQLPFQTTDPIELVHCHIAQQPAACQEIISTIPEAVSNIVMKLLAKTPEERYQTAWGLKADLETCLNQLQTTGEISVFPLGSRDISDKFQIPQKLYGREQEVTQLLTTFDRVRQGSTEILMVSGYSGIGKSALINEIHKPIVRQRGYFIGGKFDQLKRDIPYAAISQAFEDLIRQLLSEPATKLQTWKERIIEALGLNAQVIIDVIPEVEKIIGKQPQVEQLGATESQNRFNLFFQRFISVFCKQEHPLVIFLDDLQWADLPSLNLFEQLTTEPNSQYLLMIGAYRNNEVNDTHPLILTLEKIQKLGVNINNIILSPLTRSQVNQLIADSLGNSTESCKDLAELLTNKTQGNPFFLTQLLQSLYKDNLFSFAPKEGRWQWDIEEIKSIQITENVVELMIQKIESLNKNTQKALKLAACIGSRFDLEVLSVVNTKSQSDTTKDLWPAIQQGLILPLNENYRIPLLWNQDEIYDNTSDIFPDLMPEYPKSIPYKFLHDRVQQASYALIPEAEKKAVHLQVGKLLLENTKEELLGENLFEIVNQLNEGLELITEQSKKDELANLNFQAGKKAKSSAAYEPSLRYLETGLGLLSQSSWQYQYDLTLNLHIEILESLYLTTKFQEVENLSIIIFENAQKPLDRVRIYQVKIQSYIAQFQQEKAIKTASKALAELGVNIPEETGEIENQIAQQQESLNLILKDKEIKDLVDNYPMTDLYQIAVASILREIVGPTIQINFLLHILVVLTQVNLCIKYGNPPQAASNYASYGLILCSSRQFNLGYEFGKLSLKLLEKFDFTKKLEALVVHVYYGFIWHWKNSLKDKVAEEKLLKGFQQAIDIGDNEYASYTSISYCWVNFLAGTNLEEVESNYKKYSKIITKLRQEYSIYYIKIVQSSVKFLMEKSENEKFVIIGSSEKEEQDFLENLSQNNNQWLLFLAYFIKETIYYLFKDPIQAFTNSINAEKYVISSGAYITGPQHKFYSSLALLYYYNNCNPIQQVESLEQVTKNQEDMKEWTTYCPENFQNKYALVEAEKARVLGQTWEAQELYEQAIQGAKKSEFIHEEALAYERAAEFYLSLGREEIGQLYLRNAHYCYTQWGAKAKVTALETEYPQLRVRITNRTETNRTSTTSTGSNGEVLDLTTVIKASQALAGEIVLEKLLAKLMQFAIENAGAQKGYLILVNNNKLTIEAAREVGKDEVTVLQSQSVETTDLLPQGIINYAMRTQEDLVLSDATHQGLFINEPYIVENQPKSVLCAPIINQGKLIGLLYLENNLTTDAFTADRLELLRILSAQAAISIENALLYQTLEQKVEERTAQLAQANTEIVKLNDRLKEDNLRMSAELDITRELQQMILPKESELQQIPGLDIAGFMEPATEVGGDYYDVLNQDGRIKIGIGDVTGHGLESGVVMIMAQTAVRALLANNETDPVSFLSAVNQAIYGNVQRMNADKMLSLALLDYQDGTVRISGQHEEVILIRADGSLELIDTMNLGFPIGLESDVADFISELEIVLNPGDGIVLYTDGITEAENPEKELYGLERLCEVVRQNYTLSATEMQQNIIADVRRYIGTQEVFDDITLVVLKQK
ncbi:AAA family ATPase [Kamptonema animale CS-326]|jgi:predicted ATPase/serine phosphatase RsbU (regulator of sigma subunit)|uniref:AAA family ATPase n=1 Tax=Kamptonema animale TaxID=92934 RepID=UPI002330C341|nr:AAA family ATPase [Kamptonema animale]MDB9512569.1 AAA family ATPase [Kamptonema animale CS-326]